MGCGCSSPKSISTLSPQNGPSAMTILVIGLDNSGKTTLSRTINGEIDPMIVPTVGFSAPIRRRLHGKDVVFYDLGGGSRIRGVWPQYFADVHGVVYIVDGADRTRLDESKTELHTALRHPMVVGKPVLILANKADVEGAMSTEDIERELELDKLTLCRHTLVQCTARALVTTETAATTSSIPPPPSPPPLGNAPASLDPRVNLGLQWLIEAVVTDWPALEERRKREQVEHKKAEDLARKERLRRLAEEQVEMEKIAAAAKANTVSGSSALTSGTSSAVVATTEGSSSEASTAVPVVALPAPAAASGPVCKVCKVAPAVRRSAAAGWEAVCDPCGNRLEGEREATKRKQQQQLEGEEEEKQTTQQQTTEGPASSSATTPAKEPATEINIVGEVAASSVPTENQPMHTTGEPKSPEHQKHAEVVAPKIIITSPSSTTTVVNNTIDDVASPVSHPISLAAPSAAAAESLTSLLSPSSALIGAVADGSASSIISPLTSTPSKPKFSPSVASPDDETATHHQHHHDSANNNDKKSVAAVIGTAGEEALPGSVPSSPSSADIMFLNSAIKATPSHHDHHAGGGLLDESSALAPHMILTPAPQPATSSTPSLASRFDEVSVLPEPEMGAVTSAQQQN